MKRFYIVLASLSLVAWLFVACHTKEPLSGQDVDPQNNISLLFSLGAAPIDGQKTIQTRANVPDYGTANERTLKNATVFFYPVTGANIVAADAVPVFVHTEEFNPVSVLEGNNTKLLKIAFGEALIKYKVLVVANAPVVVPKTIKYGDLKALTHQTRPLLDGRYPTFTYEGDCDLATSPSISAQLQRDIVRLDLQMKPDPASNVASIKVISLKLCNEPLATSYFKIPTNLSITRGDYEITDRTMLDKITLAAGAGWTNLSIYTSPVEGALIIEGPAHYAMEVEFTFKNGSKVNQYYPRILINNGGEVMRNKIYRLTITASGNPDFSTKSEVLQWQTVGSDIDLRMTAMDSFDAVGKSYHVKVNGGVSPYKYQWYVNDELRSESSTGRSTDYRIEPLRYTDILDCNLKCVVTDANGTTCTATHAAGLLRMTMMDSVSSATDLRYMQNWDSKFDDIEIQNGGPNASRVRYLRDKRDNRVYRVKKMASNAWWMVQNLAYQPSKSDINTSKPGFYGGTVFPWPDRVSMGYYSYPVVFQVPYQTLAADIPEKVQGICPQGWRVPNNEDFKAVYPLFTSSESNYPQLSGTNDAGAQDFELEAERYALSQNGTMERLAWMKSKYYLWSSSNWPGQSNRKTTVYGNTIDGIMFLRNNEPDWGSVNGYLMAVRCVRDIVIYM